MAGTKQGALKAAQANKQKDAAYLKMYGRTFYQQIGHVGGQVGRGHKFGHGKVDPREAGRVGGSRSKRGPAKPKISMVYTPFNVTPVKKHWWNRK